MFQQDRSFEECNILEHQGYDSSSNMHPSQQQHSQFTGFAPGMAVGSIDDMTLTLKANSG